MRGQRHAPAALYPGKDPVSIVQEAGWAPGPVWTGAEILALTGIRSPGRPARSQSLYRLRYPAHANFYAHWQNFENLRLASSCLSVCPSVRMEQLGSQRTDFIKIYMSIFRKFVQKIRVS